MASIIKTSINLNNIPKEKIFVGKKGKYLPVTITINDELDQFGNQGPVVVEQTKEERDAYYHELTQSQQRAIDSDLKKESNASMPIQAPNRQTHVEFGNPENKPES